MNWSAHFSEWVAAGQPPELFGRVTFREAGVIMRASRLRDGQLAWQAAQYMKFAYHQPNEMPDMPCHEVTKGVSTQSDIVEAKAWMRAISGVSHGG